MVTECTADVGVQVDMTAVATGLTSNWHKKA